MCEKEMKLVEKEMPKQQPIPTPQRETTEARIITSQEFDELRNAGNHSPGKSLMQGELFQPSIPKVVRKAPEVE